MIPRLLSFFLLLFSYCAFAWAAPSPASIFGEHMVLQRDRPIPVWGTAKPGEIVTVSLSTGTHAAGTTDDSGRWKVMLPAMPSGGPFIMKIENHDGAVVLRDVMIGEVWLFSGQSNMTFPLERASNANTAIASADHPDIRLFTVSKASALQPQTQLNGSWQAMFPRQRKRLFCHRVFLRHRTRKTPACAHRSHPQLMAGQHRRKMGRCIFVTA